MTSSATSPTSSSEAPPNRSSAMLAIPVLAAWERLGAAALDAQDLLLGLLDDRRRQRCVMEVGRVLLAVVDRPVEQPGQSNRLRLLGHALVCKNPGEARDRIRLRARCVHDRDPQVVRNRGQARRRRGRRLDGRRDEVAVLVLYLARQQLLLERV